MEKLTMQKLFASSLIALAVVSGSALAQTPAPKTQTPPAAAAAIDPAVDAKFKAVDKNNNGVLDGAELTLYKADMAKIDTDKDGKISRAEFAVAVKSGLIK